MAATPQYGTMKFIGLVTGQTYTKDIYLSDVANARVRWDGGLGASSTSPEFFTPPEPVVMQDYAQVTGTADTTKLQVCRAGVPTGDILRYTIHLTTLNNRPALNIVFAAGQDISANQLA